MNQTGCLLIIKIMLFVNLTPLFSEDLTFNCINAFHEIKERQAFAFLVGNNHFEEESLQDLSHCIDDVLLIKGLLTECVKVPEQNIHAYFNIGARELTSAWREFTSQLTSGALVILFFSSHGTEKGSLVLSDSSRLTAGDLRRMVNGFPQDTVLILDACYSGDGENLRGLDDFKENSLRLYSSLGYSPSRELKYRESPFFQGMKGFFEQLPGVPPLEGNGYFTALIGNFFAQYPFEKNQNVSFFTFFSFLSGQGREYLEYLGRKKGFELSELELSILKESKLPKMEPIHQDIPFKNTDNLNIILNKAQQSFRPEKNYLSLSLSPAMAIIVNKESQYNIGAATMTSLNFNFNFQRGGILAIGFKTAYSYNALTAAGAMSGLDYQQAVIPITLSLAYKSNMISPLQITGELYGGYLLWHNLFYDPHREALTSYPIVFRSKQLSFGGGVSLGANYSLSQSWNLGVSISASYFFEVMTLYPGISITRTLKEF